MVLGTGDNPIRPTATLSSVYLKRKCPPGLLKPFFILQCLVILLPLVFFQSFDHYVLSSYHVISSYHELPQVGQSYHFDEKKVIGTTTVTLVML